MGNTAIPSTKPIAAINYFVSIGELSARNAPKAQEETVREPSLPYSDTLTSLLPYAPLVLFVLLFIVAFGIQVVNKIRDTKHIIVAIFIALFAASVPTVLTYVQNGTRQEARAGPEEVPRNVQVTPGESGGVRVLWTTDAERYGTVRIGKKPLTDVNSRVFVGDDQAQVRDHHVVVTGLQKGQTYQFEILSGTTWYDNAGSYVEFIYK